MSNRADPADVKLVELGPCRCPGLTHANDSAQVVRRLGYGARGAFREAVRRSGLEAGHLVVILHGVKSWTLTMPDGTPRPITPTEVALLDDATVEGLIDGLDEAFDEDPLPNASGALSPDGSSESAIPTPVTPLPIETPPSSTTT